MAGIGGGLGGAVGIAAESTYGTFVPPTRWVEVRSAKLQERQHIAQGTGLAYGRTVDLGSRRRRLWSDGGGTLELEFLNSGMGLLLQHAFGSSATLAQIGSTTAYSGTFNYGVPDNQNYLSLQSLVPHTDGTLTPENYHGCKITKTTFTADLQNPLMWTLDIDAQTKEESTAAVAPTYTTATRIFTPVGMNFLVGAFGSEATIDGVRKITFAIERTLKVDRIYLGETNKLEPITNGVTKITGSVDVDLSTANKSALWDLYHSQAAVPSIVLDFVGDAIGTSGHNDELKINITDAFIDTGGTPELDGPDIVSATLAFNGLIDASNHTAVSAVLTTADTTL